MKVIEYDKGVLKLIDQRFLPVEERYFECRTLEDVVYAIKEMVVRGAPLISISAAYGVCVGLYQYKNASKIDYIFSSLRNARPTAYNIFAILDRIEKKIKNSGFKTIGELIKIVEEEAKNIHEEDRELCNRIARNGVKVLSENANVITICNTGMLATGGIGTALGVVYEGYRLGKIGRVYVLETRPLLQGARLTMYELMENNVPSTLITDNMIAFLFSREKVDVALVGADRIVRNGDTANKIGTYNLAVICNHFKIPFYVVAPYTTIDLELEDGSQIPIEERKVEEVKFFRQQQTAPMEAEVWNPAFDITPSELITGIITDKGIFKPNEISKIAVNQF
ncbi:MAG: S-methyl-5-thioribose-1-phosphate isomerase [Spirochaetia bacterium]|nr:S-methyl-5-thioribose-1-phosphate isomerase [Spirochaetota bacterium]MCX8097154.1 S-methyl-5-thioribose-1-phosphate isomerase [Spirochaetota bacterium]MDW8113094.1 S-methyl-5-thioribose-1-phosphate isomerase [Spirochaetia bacterium]